MAKVSLADITSHFFFLTCMPSTAASRMMSATAVSACAGERARMVMSSRYAMTSTPSHAAAAVRTLCSASEKMTGPSTVPWRAPRSEAMTASLPET